MRWETFRCSMVWKLVGEGSPSFDKKNTTGGHFPQFRTKKRLKGPCKYNAPSLVWGRLVAYGWGLTTFLFSESQTKMLMLTRFREQKSWFPKNMLLATWVYTWKLETATRRPRNWLGASKSFLSLIKFTSPFRS